MKAQHAWASNTETVDFFSKNRLKEPNLQPDPNPSTKEPGIPRPWKASLTSEPDATRRCTEGQVARERAQALIVSANLSSSGRTRGQARPGQAPPASAPLKGEVVIRRCEPLTGMRSGLSAPTSGYLFLSGERRTFHTVAYQGGSP